MLPPELNRQRLDRFYQLCYLPASVSVAFFAIDRSLVILAPDRHFDELSRRLDSLKDLAWIILGATQISLFCRIELICVAKLRSINTRTEDSPMVATATRPIAAKKTASENSHSAALTIPTVRSLKTIAQNTNLSEAEIASEIIGLGELAFFDEEAGTHKASEAGISAWADDWLDRDRESRKAKLLQTNGKVEITADHAPESTPKAKQIRFRDFEIANSYSKTIGNFLDAQSYSAEERTAIVEQLANLPIKQVEDSESLPEKILAKIISKGKHPTAKRPGARKSLIQSIKKDMLGKNEPEIEPLEKTA